MSTAPPARRTLRFESLDAILADAEQLAVQPHRVLGNWSLGQILEHLALNIDAFFSGFGFQAPWLVRWTVGPLLKRRILTRGMAPGFRLPQRAAVLLPEPAVATDEGLRHLRSAVERLKHDVPTRPHPVLGRMTQDEVCRLTQRHAELHLSFVVPETATGRTESECLPGWWRERER